MTTKEKNTVATKEQKTMSQLQIIINKFSSKYFNRNALLTHDINEVINQAIKIDEIARTMKQYPNITSELIELYMLAQYKNPATNELLTIKLENINNINFINNILQFNKYIIVSDITNINKTYDKVNNNYINYFTCNISFIKKQFYKHDQVEQLKACGFNVQLEEQMEYMKADKKEACEQISNLAYELGIKI